MRLVTIGAGAQASPAYAPAGLLIVHGVHRVMLDGGLEAAPKCEIDAWLVSDARSELHADLRRRAFARGLSVGVGSFAGGGLVITPRPVAHTNHPTYGYWIEANGAKVVWAPEFFRFPRWARGVDLMFGEAAGWDRPIRFRGGAGGHMAALAVATAARRAHVRRLVFAHIGRPTLRAICRGQSPPFGEFAHDGEVFYLRRSLGR